MLLGLFDRRPWEGAPSGRDADWFRAYVKPALGETLSVRLQAEPAAPTLDLADPVPGSWSGVWSAYALSVIVAGWEDADGSLVPPVGAVPSNPLDPASAGWWPARLARLGPNVMHGLGATGACEVDLGAWAGAGARFVAAWLWAYWLGPLPRPLAVSATVLVRPSAELRPSGPQVVTLPIVRCFDGPFPAAPIATEAWTVARFGSFPGFHGGSPLGVSILNGNAANMTFEIHHVSGPSFAGGGTPGEWQRSAPVVPGGTWVAGGWSQQVAFGPGFLITHFDKGIAGLDVCASSTVAGGAFPGPVLISCVGPG